MQLYQHMVEQEILTAVKEEMLGQKSNRKKK